MNVFETVKQSVTTRQAEELTGKGVWDFVDILKSYHISWGEYTEEDLQMDEIALEKLIGGTG